MRKIFYFLLFLLNLITINSCFAIYKVIPVEKPQQEENNLSVVKEKKFKEDIIKIDKQDQEISEEKIKMELDKKIKEKEKQMKFNIKNIEESNNLSNNTRTDPNIGEKQRNIQINIDNSDIEEEDAENNNEEKTVDNIEDNILEEILDESAQTNNSISKYRLL